ncbi:5208_t:CDS:1 [Cetraspora pellucida]|uniref:5208_t:CDS:1 n=1 Tax=Cetraspora pellucida TaxID=1433469 RepID=A0ACA9JZ19_9GLOM|nr:5208_t:CDS:1 [Cetraspora pellucida]
MQVVHGPLPPLETIIVIIVVTIATFIIGVIAIGITLSAFRRHSPKDSHFFETTIIDNNEQQQPGEVNNFVESGFLEEPSTLELEQENIIMPNYDLVMLQYQQQQERNHHNKFQERRDSFDINFDDGGETSFATI